MGPWSYGKLDRMRTAYSVETVRNAERELMARLPEGALMQRAAAGLAAACADLLGRVYGSRVVLLVGSGDNGGDALYAGARLARRGAGVTAVLLSMAIFSGVQIVLIGLVGAYIARIFEEVKGRPLYLVAETINIAST